MILFERGAADCSLSSADLRQALETALDKFGTIKKMLIVPPDITRLPSRAGELTRFAYERDPSAVWAILPALGTHCPMTPDENRRMFGDVPGQLFLTHNWRTDCLLLGQVPADYIAEVSEGSVTYPILVQINRHLFEKSLDCILSINQVVPHEVAGMAGFSKNIVVGLGGTENIHKTHFLGAAYGIERIMGKMDSPVRKVLDHILEKHCHSLPLVHAITVVGKDADGTSKTRGIFIGTDRECYLHAAELSRCVNIHLLDKPLKKVVVYLDPVEYKSTWLGNKSIYRTRMAIADGGELIVLAPGVKVFGEDPDIDRLVSAFGYKGTASVMRFVRENQHLRNNLSAAAHLIHGSSEGRFSITYCPGMLKREDVENVGYAFSPMSGMCDRYDPRALKQGPNVLPDGEEIYFISNPAAGLWACKEKF
jgi:nickel-dependent lactate racemase